jgi:hypothetical protein
MRVSPVSQRDSNVELIADIPDVLAGVKRSSGESTIEIELVSIFS